MYEIISNIFLYNFITGLYGNDDLHNGLLEVLTAGRKVDNIVQAVRNQVRSYSFLEISLFHGCDIVVPWLSHGCSMIL